MSNTFETCPDCGLPIEPYTRVFPQRALVETTAAAQPIVIQWTPYPTSAAAAMTNPVFVIEGGHK